jgi:hypothetical protein
VSSDLGQVGDLRDGDQGAMFAFILNPAVGCRRLAVSRRFCNPVVRWSGLTPVP